MNYNFQITDKYAQTVINEFVKQNGVDLNVYARQVLLNSILEMNGKTGAQLKQEDKKQRV